MNKSLEIYIEAPVDNIQLCVNCTYYVNGEYERWCAGKAKIVKCVETGRSIIKNRYEYISDVRGSDLHCSSYEEVERAEYPFINGVGPLSKLIKFLIPWPKTVIKTFYITKTDVEYK